MVTYRVMSNNGPINIDVKKALEGKLGANAKFVPRFAINWLKRTVCEDDLNNILRQLYPKRGAEFCEGALDLLDVHVKMRNEDRLPSADNARVIFVCNHPLGGLDGIALIAMLVKHYGPDVRFVVNDLLMAVEPISEFFLPINKHGRQQRNSAADINAALAGEAPVVIFPAGLVSRKGRNGVIMDLAWHKMFVVKALQHHRDIVPLHFSGQNSPFFYNLAQWRQRLGVKFNIEMLYLPGELLKSRGKTFVIDVGNRVSWRDLAKPDHNAIAAMIRDMAYSLNQNNQAQ